MPSTNGHHFCLSTSAASYVPGFRLITIKWISGRVGVKSFADFDLKDLFIYLFYFFFDIIWFSRSHISYFGKLIQGHTSRHNYKNVSN